jgi:hypothetical protein
LSDQFFGVERQPDCAQRARALAPPNKYAGSALINHVEKFSRERSQTAFARSIPIRIERIASK